MEFKRRLQPTARVDLIPMIDVVFQLVVFFMVSSTLVTKTGLNIDLPQAQAVQEAVTSTVVLSVVSENEIFLGDRSVTLAELDAILAQQSEEFEDRSISIEADETIPYGTMIAVLDVLRRNGLRGANLVAEQRPEAQ